MASGNKLISIIVPVYNASKSLSDCIESILAQTYPFFELILIDDGSKDNSLEICESYREKDDRIVLMHQENAGVSAARNAGLSLAKGDYFCFVDSDDTIEAEMLEKLYDAIKRTNADLSICGFKRISSKGITKISSMPEEVTGKVNIANFVAEHYLEGLVSSPCGRLYKNIQSLQKEFDRNISLGEDLKFNIQYFEKIEKLVVIEDCLYRYVDAESSLTKIYKQGHYEAICDIYETTIQYFLRVFKNIKDIVLKNVNYKLFSFCISFMSQNMAKAGLKESKVFIATICDNKLLQDAIRDLPNMSFARNLYVWGIKRKAVSWLWIISYLKLLIFKYLI